MRAARHLAPSLVAMLVVLALLVDLPQRLIPGVEADCRCDLYPTCCCDPSDVMADSCANCTIFGTPATCDDGIECTADVACNATFCPVAPAGTPDPLYCNTTHGDHPCGDWICDPSTGCTAINLNDTACDDGIPCTADTCTVGGCSNVGVDVLCDDGHDCSIDTCSNSTGCEYSYNNTACEVSEGGHECADWECGVSGCQLTNFQNSLCDDGFSCTTDICQVSGCNITAFDSACDDAQACTLDLCDLSTSVTGCSNNHTCDDGIDCTTDSCNVNTCENTAMHGLCDDAKFCTVDECVVGFGCNSTASAALCGTDDMCTTYSCNAFDGSCSNSTIDCDDGIPCTIDSCNPATGCEYTLNHTACIDAFACTTDTCTLSGCSNAEVDALCDDGHDCSIDTCSNSTGCEYSYNNTACEVSEGGHECADWECGVSGCQLTNFQNSLCDDGFSCTTDICQVSGCNITAFDSACDDSMACTIDVCDLSAPVTGCNNTVACDDGIACTNDFCDGGGDCVNSVDNGLCDDGIPCTDDVCDAVLGCVLTPMHVMCDDSIACTNNTCVIGSGCEFPPWHAACDDGDGCTVDTCNTTEGMCTYVVECDDGVDCTSDACVGNDCVFTPIPNYCNDGLDCTDDACHLLADCQYTVNNDNCDDNNPCTLDLCSGSTGECSYGDFPCGDGKSCVNSTLGEAECVDDPTSGPEPFNPLDPLIIGVASVFLLLVVALLVVARRRPAPVLSSLPEYNKQASAPAAAGAAGGKNGSKGNLRSGNGGNGNGNGSGRRGSAGPPGSRRTSGSKRRGSSAALKGGAFVAPETDYFASGFANTAPPALVECFEYVQDHGLQTEGIFRLAPSKSSMMELLYPLLSNPDSVASQLLKVKDINIVAGALKAYFRDTKDPVLPASLLGDFEKAMGFAAKKQLDAKTRAKRLGALLKKLPPARYDTLKRLFQMLVAVAENEAVNKMGVSQLSTVWGPNLLRTSDATANAGTMRQGAMLVSTCIEHFRIVFRGR